MSKIVSTKINALFLAFVLIAGTIAAIFPLFLTGADAQAQPYYDGIDSYDKLYEKDRDKSKDSKVDIKKVKCNNINVNVNGIDVGIGGLPNGNGPVNGPIAETQTSDDEGQTTITSASSFGNGGERNNDGYQHNDKDGFAYVCLNNNDNRQVTPIDATETLTVIKNVDCLANSTICANNPISPSDFTILIEEGNNPSQNNFPGSSDGTNVELEQGPYNVTEEGLDTSPHPVCTRLGYEASSSLGNNLFICTNFSDGCEGDITIGNPQTCTIDNVLVSCEVTVDPTITGFNRPTYVAHDSANERIYVTNFGNDTVSVIDTNTNTVIGSPITVGDGPAGIAYYDPVNERMYVANEFDDTVSVIDTNTNTVIDTIPVGERPIGIAYDPVNHRMYVANFNSNTVSVINLC